MENDKNKNDVDIFEIDYISLAARAIIAQGTRYQAPIKMYFEISYIYIYVMTPLSSIIIAIVPTRV